MPVSFGDLVTDLKESRFFQVWTIMWVIVAVVFFIGFANVTNTSGANAITNPYQLYRIFEQDGSGGINFPAFQLSTVSTKESIASLTCNDANNAVINVINSTTAVGQPALTVQSTGVKATVSSSEFGCLIWLSNGNSSNVSTHVRISVSDNGFASAETIYIKTNDIKTYVVLQKTAYTTGSLVQSYYNPWSYGNGQSGQGSGINMLFIKFGDFNVVNYQQANIYGGWQAYADIGGMLMFAYVMHLLLMLILGTFVANDSRVLGGARGSYDQVN